MARHTQSVMEFEDLPDYGITVGLYILPFDTPFCEYGDEDKMPRAYMCSGCADPYIRAGAVWVGDTRDYKCDKCGIEPDGFDG